MHYPESPKVSVRQYVNNASTICLLLFQFVPIAVGIAAVFVTAVLAKILLADKSKKKKNPVTLVGKNTYTSVICIPSFFSLF